MPNQTLAALIQSAESRLAPGDRNRLAELVEAFVTTRESSPAFTAEEQAHLQSLDQTPFDPSESEAVAALFARRG